MNLKLTGEPIRWLSFDIEARPLSWLGGDRVTREITAIAWKYIGEKTPPQVVLLGETTTELMLATFLEHYNYAGGVTGHFIRGYDLPTVNGALIEHGMPKLKPKLTHDTCNDLVRLGGLSKSQENLSAMLGLRQPKVKMSDPDWREANRLRPEGLKKTAKRVAGDVEQQIELRDELIKRKLISMKPKLWKPGGK